MSVRGDNSPVLILPMAASRPPPPTPPVHGTALQSQEFLLSFCVCVGRGDEGVVAWTVSGTLAEV